MDLARFDLFNGLGLPCTPHGFSIDEFLFFFFIENGNGLGLPCAPHGLGISEFLFPFFIEDEHEMVFDGGSEFFILDVGEFFFELVTFADEFSWEDFGAKFFGLNLILK